MYKNIKRDCMKKVISVIFAFILIMSKLIEFQIMKVMTMKYILSSRLSFMVDF